MDRRVAKMAALGRHFEVGNLYNYRNDIVIPDRWMNEESLHSKLAIQVHSSFKSKFICLDSESSTSQKWEHMMGIDEHLQASILSGVIDKFRGASNYLNDRPQQPAPATRTLVCRVKSRKECLDPQALINSQSEKDLAAHFKSESISRSTHLVVGVTYGAEAYCVLTHDKKEGENVDREIAEEILSEMAAKMEKGLGDDRDLENFKKLFDDEEMRQLDGVKCRLYADLQSQSVRECSVFDAYKFCFKLVRQAQNGMAVPVAVRLFPLKFIAAPARGIQPLDYRDVDADLVVHCQRILENLERIVATADAIRSTSKRIRRASLRHFREAVAQYQELLRASLKNGIWKAREIGEGDDEEVEKVIGIAQNHPLFKPCRLERWIGYKQSESEMVEMMASVKGVVFFASRNQLEREMADSFGKNFALVLRVPPMDEKTGKMLEAMRNYLDGCTELVAAGRDDEDTDEEEDHQLEEDGIPWHMIQRKRKQVLDKIRELANHVERNKHLEDQVQFCITSGEPGKGGCRYSVYEGDHLVQDNLIHLPSPPRDLRVQLVTSGGGRVSQKSPSFRIEWNYKDRGYPCQFLVEFRPKGSCDESWMQRKATLPGENQTTVSFQSGSAMEIRVAAETCIGRSEFSDVVHTESVHADESDEFRSISGPTSLRSGDWSNHFMQDANPFFSSSPRRQEQQQQRKSSSTPRIAELFAEQGQLIKQGSPNVYLLNAKENSTVADFRWFDVGRKGFKSTPPPMDHRDHKVVILMGAAGSGKSTLINGMVNYILGVEWKDPFRFQCVRQDDLRVHHSQPGSVTAYTLRHQDGMAVPYSITIVETPGYGNTKGARRDREVTRKIQRFLTQEKIRVDQIHAVCFVAASNDIRSTSMHPYILDSVLSLFGRDIKDNIRLLVTFADMAHPPVVEACASAKFPVTSAGGIAYSKFDNSVLYASNEQQDEDDFSFDELFWQMGQENYQKFFAVLEKMSGRDLASTREVIQRRLLLDQSLKDIERGLEVYLANVENVQMFRRKIKEYGDKMEANRNFVLETKEVRRVKVDCDRGFVAYNCRHCQRTCEGPVRSINFDYFRKSKKQCSHIFCPCPAFEHEYQQFQWRQTSEKVITILPEMKAEYESNCNDKLTTEKLLMGCLHELKMTKAKLFCLLARVGSSCLLLEATALRSNTLSLADYLSLMRSRVAEELAPGYLTRLEILKELQQSLARRASESNALETLHAGSPAINRNRRKVSCQFDGEWQSVETLANSFAIDGCWS